jgi:hypothetical protein
MDTRLSGHARVAAAASTGLVLLVGCGAGGPIKGEIRDAAFTLAVDHAPTSVRFELRNLGTKPCDLVAAQTSLPMNALPVKDGKVVIAQDGSANSVRAMTGGEFPGQVEPGADFAFELGMESTPATDQRIIFCNGVGDYESGRYAVLRFDR